MHTVSKIYNIKSIILFKFMYIFLRHLYLLRLKLNFLEYVLNRTPSCMTLGSY